MTTIVVFPPPNTAFEFALLYLVIVTAIYGLMLLRIVMKLWPKQKKEKKEQSEDIPEVEVPEMEPPDL